jgi:4-azaleucine resistance transporter AzlC
MLTVPDSSPKARPEWIEGVITALPIAVGYVPVAVSYGVLAREAGLSSLNTLLMSLLVYAGASQLVAVGLFAADVFPSSIVLTVFIVNLRHLILTSALAPYLARWTRWEQALFGFEVTDETFAVHATRFAEGEGLAGAAKASSLALNVTAQVAWLSGTLLGILIKGHISDVRPLGLDYALPALFLALIVLQIKRWIHVAVAIVSGTLAVALLRVGWSRWYIILATLAGATFGVLLEKWITPQSS